jgi:hypothetical protein
LRQWREPDAELFEVEDADGVRRVLRHDRVEDAWTVQVKSAGSASAAASRSPGESTT